MSTRTNFAIGPEDSYKIIAYKHHDGYPSGVEGIEKAKTIKEFKRLVMELDGYEEDNTEHGDIEYLYRFHKGKVWCQKQYGDSTWYSFHDALMYDKCTPCKTCGRASTWPGED